MPAQERTDRIYNLDLYNPDKVCGEWDLPELQAEDHVPERLIGFKYANQMRDIGAGVHFFVWDHHFEQVWRNPVRYGESLRKFDCVLEPDFSMYRDMSRAQQAYNLYRARLVAQVWQQMGLRVIPTAKWGSYDTIEYALDGLPEDSVIAISTKGNKRDKHAANIFRCGVEALIEKKRPKTLLVYGGVIPCDYRGVQIVQYEDEMTRRMRNGERR